jgi:hypothetical protein
MTNKLSLIFLSCFLFFSCTTKHQSSGSANVKLTKRMFGAWHCRGGIGAATLIKGTKEIELCLADNLIWIKTRAKAVPDSGSLYNLYFVETSDVSPSVTVVDWENISTSRPVATIRIIDDTTILKKWLGLFNTSGKSIQDVAIDWEACDTIFLGGE